MDFKICSHFDRCETEQMIKQEEALALFLTVPTFFDKDPTEEWEDVDSEDEDEEEMDEDEDETMEQDDSDLVAQSDPMPAALPGSIPVTDCLFCSHHSKSLMKNLSHMTKVHSFFIPDVEFLVDLKGLICYLGELPPPPLLLLLLLILSSSSYFSFSFSIFTSLFWSLSSDFCCSSPSVSSFSTFFSMSSSFSSSSSHLLFHISSSS